MSKRIVHSGRPTMAQDMKSLVEPNT
ncbi:MAG: hypothetical protein QOJ85_3695, partial [Solirubrobacteraceae bacterium]|nr:hypothetical protein [Solirubrobacteraceae bacterium]